MSTADDVTNVLAVGLALTNTLGQAFVAVQAWQTMAAAAQAEGRTDFTPAELDRLHAAMHAATDRFLNRDFTGGDPPPT